MKISLLIQNMLDFITVAQNNWGALHPAIVHFPIALLSVVPFFILLGLIFKKSSQTFYQTSLILMLFGSTAMFLAFSTGSTVADTLDVDRSIFPTLKQHYLLAEQTRLIFSVFAGVFLIFVSCYSFLTKKFSQRTIALATSIYLIAYAFCLLFLLNTAHYGGMLVHQHGVKSNLYSK